MLTKPKVAGVQSGKVYVYLHDNDKTIIVDMLKQELDDADHVDSQTDDEYEQSARRHIKAITRRAEEAYKNAPDSTTFSIKLEPGVDY